MQVPVLNMKPVGLYIDLSLCCHPTDVLDKCMLHLNTYSVSLKVFIISCYIPYVVLQNFGYNGQTVVEPTLLRSSTFPQIMHASGNILIQNGKNNFWLVALPLATSIFPHFDMFEFSSRQRKLK